MPPLYVDPVLRGPFNDSSVSSLRAGDIDGRSVLGLCPPQPLLDRFPTEQDLFRTGLVIVLAPDKSSPADHVVQGSPRDLVLLRYFFGR